MSISQIVRTTGRTSFGLVAVLTLLTMPFAAVPFAHADATTPTVTISGQSPANLTAVATGTPVSFTATATNFQGDPVTYSVSDSVTGGTPAAIDASTGVFTWTPSATADVGTHTFTVTAVNTGSTTPLTASATLPVTVISSNTPSGSGAGAGTTGGSGSSTTGNGSGSTGGTNSGSGSSASQTTAAPCTTGIGSPLVVDVTQNISNDPDSGNFGGDWALDNFTRHIQIWQEGTHYCAQATDNGTFTTFGGVTGKSPQSGNALPQVVSGTMVGGTRGVITGTLQDAGNWGHTGTAPAQNCNSQDCSMTSLWVSNYFGNGTYDYSDAPSGNWSWVYTAAPGDAWTNASTGSTGDVVYVPPSSVYVNDSTGADSNDGSAAHPFQTIAAAISAVATGGTVNIAAGTYAGGITISKALTIKGANSGVSQNAATHVDGTVFTSGAPAIQINTTDPVVIDGVTFNGTGSPVGAVLGSNITIENSIIENTVGNATLYLANSNTFNFENNYTTNLSTASDEGIFLAGNWNGSTGTHITITGNLWKNSQMTGMNLSDVTGTISGNTFSNVAYYGILVANNSPLTITGNTFDTITSPDTSVSTYGSGIRFYTPSLTAPVTITGNTFSNSVIGIGVRSPADLTGMNITVSGNTFTNDTFGIKDDGLGALNASNNYWGSATGPGVSASPIGGTGSANVTYSPWYADAGMTTFGYTTTTNGTTNGATIAAGITGSTNPSSSSNVSVSAPAGTVVTGDTSWNGVIELPTVVVSPTIALTGETVTPSVAIEVGSPTTSLTLSRAARLLFAGQAGKQVGWSLAGGTFTPITATCTADTQAANDLLAAGADCTMNVGADLVVWTKHFTTFATYTSVATPVVSSGGGFSGGTIYGGGSGSVTTTGSTGSVGTTGTTGTGQVLGASTYNFASNLTMGMRSEDVTQLQTVLIADGYLNITAPTGYFGALTKAAVTKFQAANKLPATGFVGPLTLAVLNAGTTPTTLQENASVVANLKAQIAALQVQLNALIASTTTSK